MNNLTAEVQTQLNIKAFKALMLAAQEMPDVKRTGRNQYGGKSIEDKELRRVVQPVLRKHGILIIPKSIEEKVTEKEIEVTDKKGKYKRQTRLTEVKVTYHFTHTSGGFVEIIGYGHSADVGTFGSTLAQLFALKRVLLDVFLLAETEEEGTGKHPKPQTFKENSGHPTANNLKAINECKTIKDLQTFTEFTKQNEIFAFYSKSIAEKHAQLEIKHPTADRLAKIKRITNLDSLKKWEVNFKENKIISFYSDAIAAQKAYLESLIKK